MNWDALGAIGEIAGALGVILTLLYLARQINESNRATRQSATQEIQNQIAQWVYKTNSSTELTDLWVRGNLNDNSLTLHEVIQFRATFSQLLNLWERAHSLRKEGQFDEKYWQALVLSRKNFLASHGFRSFWRDCADRYDDEYRMIIELEIKTANAEWSPLGLDLNNLEKTFEPID